MIIDALLKADIYKILGIVDNAPKADELLGIKFIGGDQDLEKIFEKGCKHAFIAVGSVGDCRARVKLAKLAKEIGFNLPVIIHPAATIGKEVSLGEGTFVGAGSIVNPGSRIGANVIVNTKASVDHDCRIGDFVHLSPGVTLSGGVEVGDVTHIGTGSSITEYLKIGAETLIGAGSNVVSNIPAKSKAYGNPCRVMEKNI